MRFAELASFTSLPLKQIEDALSSRDVRSLLPVTSGPPKGDHVLAATPGGLAIITARRRRKAGSPAVDVSWARWSRVRLGFDPESASVAPSSFDLVVHVGQRAFHALLTGPGGQKALRDFVVSVQRGVRGDLAYADYDSAALLLR